MKGNTVTGVFPITSFNVRIARNVSFGLDRQTEQLILNSRQGLVVSGAPASGKTTFLKQAIALLSKAQQRVCVVDERSELAGSRLPMHCDLLQNCNKAQGLLWAVRSLSPQVLVCDEIGGSEDAKAVCAAANAGVRMIVSMHGESKQELMKRPPCKAVLDTGAFSALLFLDTGSRLGTVREVQQI